MNDVARINLPQECAPVDRGNDRRVVEISLGIIDGRVVGFDLRLGLSDQDNRLIGLLLRAGIRGGEALIAHKVKAGIGQP